MSYSCGKYPHWILESNSTTTVDARPSMKFCHPIYIHMLSFLLLPCTGCKCQISWYSLHVTACQLLLSQWISPAHTYEYYIKVAILITCSGYQVHNCNNNNLIEFWAWVLTKSDKRVAMFPKHPETLKNTVAAVAAWYFLLVINFMHLFSIEPIQHCPPLQIDTYKCAVVGAICVKIWKYEKVFMAFLQD